MLPKCEKCPYNDSCKVNMNGACLPDLTDNIPKWWLHYRRGESKAEVVKVDLILGGFQSVRRDSYNPDFSPRSPDDRFHSILEGAVEGGIDLGRLGWPDTPIRLVSYEGHYYVGNDGHRRVSIAKMTKAPTVKALVTPLIPFAPGGK